jgi:hypothetical protein
VSAATCVALIELADRLCLPRLVTLVEDAVIAQVIAKMLSLRRSLEKAVFAQVIRKCVIAQVVAKCCHCAGHYKMLSF